MRSSMRTVDYLSPILLSIEREKYLYMSLKLLI